MDFSCAMLFGEAILDAGLDFDPVGLAAFADGAPESDEAPERLAFALVRNGALRTRIGPAANRPFTLWPTEGFCRSSRIFLGFIAASRTLRSTGPIMKAGGSFSTAVSKAHEVGLAIPFFLVSRPSAAHSSTERPVMART
jgi:hypothetical protein